MTKIQLRQIVSELDAIGVPDSATVVFKPTSGDAVSMDGLAFNLNPNDTYFVNGSNQWEHAAADPTLATQVILKQA
jgi:hypothetical protein